MTFTVRDKQFDVTFVNNWTREAYQQMLEATDDLVGLPDEADEIGENGKLDPRERVKAIREIQKRQRALVRKIAELRTAMVRELLETNGYEYDEKWWSRKTDADDMNDFALGCLQKDVKREGDPKKKRSSTGTDS